MKAPSRRDDRGARLIAGALAAALCLLCGLVAAGCSALEAASAPASTHGRIVSVADGDTVTVRLDSGPTRRVRLLGMLSRVSRPTPRLPVVAPR